MAYNNTYSPYYSNPNFYPQNFQNQMPMPQQIQPTSQIQQPQQNTQSIQNGGFMLVPSEDIVRTYPVAPGNCVTFKIEGKPIVMEKSMGFSQLEAPRIDKYRLVREEEIEPTPDPATPKECQCNHNLEEFKDKVDHDFEQVWEELNALKSHLSKPSTTKKKDNGGN